MKLIKHCFIRLNGFPNKYNPEMNKNIGQMKQ